MQEQIKENEETGQKRRVPKNKSERKSNEDG